MSRAQRLLDLIQLLRRHRRAVAGAVLAEELGVSLRTLYRDIETLEGARRAHRWRSGRGLRAPPGLHAAAADVLRGGDRGAGARLALGFGTGGRASGQGRAQRAGQDRRGAPRRPQGQHRCVGPADRPGRADRGRRRRACRDPPGDPVRAQDADRLCGRTRRAPPSGPSGPSRWPSTIACASSSPGANCAKATAISEPTASPRSMSTPERYPRRRAALLKEWRTLRGIPEQ